MEHFIRIAFWIFTLCATFSSCHPNRISLHNSHIPRMDVKVKCPADSRFYTPENVEDKCIESAFKCVLKELDTAKWECNDEEKRINEAMDPLKRHLNTTDRAVPDGCQTCESYPQTDFKKFLKKYKMLIQQNNSLGR